MNAFGVLSYTAALANGWSAMVAASQRERLGDYEGHRLPEVLLRYSGTMTAWVPTLELSAGAIEILVPSVRSTRLGAIAGLQSPVAHLAPAVELVARVRGGVYSYDTGVSHSFYQAAAELTKRFGEQRRLVLEYAQQGGSGTSPLLFDQVGFEQVLTGRLFWPVNPGITGMISAAANLHTPTITGKEYILQFNSREGWFVGGLHRVSDSRLFLLFGF